MTLEVRQTGLALPNSLEEIRGFADAFVKSGMFTDTKQLAQAIVKIQAGRELGLSPVYSMQNINVIRDRLTTSANGIAMLVKKSGRYNYRIKEHSDLHCSIDFIEDGKVVGNSTFTMEDAKRANLVKPDSGWAKFPRAMLFSRAISQGARIYCPDAIGGIYTDEEIRAIPPKPGEEPEPLPEAPQAPPPAKTAVQLPDAPAIVVNPPETPKGFIDLVWLKESLEALQWADAGKYLKNKYKVTGAKVSDLAAALTREQAEEFTKEVQERLSMK